MDEEGLLSLLPDRLALPRGRSALSKSAVDASRRGRIMQATMDEVAASGYDATTVATITTRAHVSRSSFYEAFPDKETAFAEAHWSASDRALTRLWKPALEQVDVGFDARIRRLVSSYLEVLEVERTFTICFFVEIRTGGDRLVGQRDEMLDRHVQIMHELAKFSAARDSSVRVPGLDVLRGLMGAFDELVARAVREQRGEERLDLAPVQEPFLEILTAVMHDT
ncbi:helix-turn-helix domain-containing protein [Aeromicrobium flavum]|uniref:TetR/AcrR family transcriptional regulator n=1 Tax=Aeromicrobium flavum TaxID=416568 RepID=UPI0031D2B6E1